MDFEIKLIFLIDLFFLLDQKVGSGIPELKNRFEKPSYGLWRRKIKLSQIVTWYLIFLNLETLDWKHEYKKTELRNSEILII